MLTAVLTGSQSALLVKNHPFDRERTGGRVGPEDKA